MITVLTSSKGGSGTTITAASCSLQSALKNGSALLIDLCGDVPAALGMSEPSTEGINEWLAENQTANSEALILLGNTIDNGLIVIHRGSKFVEGQPRWAELATVLQRFPMPVFIDAGSAYLPDELRMIADRVWLVTRQCYLSLRRATQLPTPTGVIVVEEEGRALTSRDVANVVGAPVVATIPVTANMARSVDAGLLVSRVAQLIGSHLPENL